MTTKISILFCILGSLAFAQCQVIPKACELKHKPGPEEFPKDFKFGVSTAAYQIEGAWNTDNKGPSIWDTFTHEFPERITDRSNGDIAADSYHRFEQDLAALKELGVDYYRFSISWPRLLPNGETYTLNPYAVTYYNTVIDRLREEGIEPMVTMFHYDLPEAISRTGGFTSSYFVEYFYFYADKLFELFGPRVKKWITFNEPYDYCVPGYGWGYYPPMVYGPGVSDYLCAENTLKAHSVVYRLYQRKYKATQGGKIGITLSSQFYFPKNPMDPSIVDRVMDFTLGWYANPLFAWAGNYPPVMIHDIARNSLREGRRLSRLQPFTGDWLTEIRGAADFLGLNYYSARYIERAPEPEGEPSWPKDAEFWSYVDPEWKVAISDWLYCVPQGLEGILKWIRRNYNNIEVYITENGWSDDGRLNDDDRIQYMKAHLQAVLNAINDGCNVTHFTQWSLIDNFEWLKGYTEKFGLYYVNMSSPNLDRIPKKSSRYYADVVKQRKVLQRW